MSSATVVKLETEDFKTGAFIRMTDEQHIKEAPDMYIGSTKVSESRIMYTYTDNMLKETTNNHQLAPSGFSKLFDEVIVNAADCVTRNAISATPDKTKRDLIVSANEKSLCVINTGDAIPIKKVEEGEENISGANYNIDVLFGQLRTSSNYNQATRFTGGKNGLGVKLTNSYSTKFIIDIVDENKNHYRGTWIGEDMSNLTSYVDKKYDLPSEITHVPEDFDKKAKRVCVYYEPNYELFDKFKVKENLKCILARVLEMTFIGYDNVYYNNNWLNENIKTFKDFVGLWFDDDVPRWFVNNAKSKYKIGIANVSTDDLNSNSPGGYSWVNNIRTSRGGIHLKGVQDQIVGKLFVDMKKNDFFKPFTLTRAEIKKGLTFFLWCLLPGPSFNGQTKETLTNIDTSVDINKLVTVADLDKITSAIMSDEDYKKYIAETWAKKIDKNNGLAELTKATTKTNYQIGLELLGKFGGSINDAEAAKLSGAKRTHPVTMLICEGKSAQASIKGGISTMTAALRPYYGNMAIRGKLRNVFNLNDYRVLLANEEIRGIMTVLGLSVDPTKVSLDGETVYTEDDVYTMNPNLRYDRIVIACDADYDGYHITGLLLNFFGKYWPELIQYSFISIFVTPVAKCGDKYLFSLSELETYIKDSGSKKSIKYYKGLGTSTTAEFSKYFADFDHHLITFYRYDRKYFVKAFDDKHANARKVWIEKYAANLKQLSTIESGVSESTNSSAGAMMEIDIEEGGVAGGAGERERGEGGVADRELLVTTSAEAATKMSTSNDLVKEYIKENASLDEFEINETVYESLIAGIVDEEGFSLDMDRMTIRTFIDKHLVKFSLYSVKRAIPCIMDGLKPTQRKIIYTALSSNQTKEIKVVDLASAVSQKVNYHHGETSLQKSIITLAQDFVGANNMELLKPIGQFGTREELGKDSAAPRYINTAISKWCEAIFNKTDLKIVEYKFEENKTIEPNYLLPVIPTLLLNGTTGIATGFSCNVMNYHPVDMIVRLKVLLAMRKKNNNSNDLKLASDILNKPMFPWFRGFSGNIKEENDRIAISGIAKIVKYSDVGSIKDVSAPKRITDIIDKYDCAIHVTELPVSIKPTSWFNNISIFSTFNATMLGRVTMAEVGKYAATPGALTMLELIKSRYGITVNPAWLGNVEDKSLKFLPNITDENDFRTYILDVTKRPSSTKKTEGVIETKYEYILVMGTKKTTIDLKSLNLVEYVSFNNMNTIDEDGSITRYKDPRIVLVDFFFQRLYWYSVRRSWMIAEKKREISFNENKKRFIELHVKDEYSIRNKTDSVINNELRSLGFQTKSDIEKTYFKESLKAGIRNINILKSENNNLNDEDDEESNTADPYKYLLDIPIRSISKKQYLSITEKLKSSEAILASIVATSHYDMWDDDLNHIVDLIRTDKPYQLNLKHHPMKDIIIDVIANGVSYDDIISTN